MVITVKNEVMHGVQRKEAGKEIPIKQPCIAMILKFPFFKAIYDESCCPCWHNLLYDSSVAFTLIQQALRPSFRFVYFKLIECSISSMNGRNGVEEGIMMMTFLPLFLSPNYPLMCDKTRKMDSRYERGLPQWQNHSFQLPVLWMGIIMFCPKHLRFSCPDLPPK